MGVTLVAVLLFIGCVMLICDAVIRSVEKNRTYIYFCITQVTDNSAGTLGLMNFDVPTNCKTQKIGRFLLLDNPFFTK